MIICLERDAYDVCVYGPANATATHRLLLH